MSGVTNVEEIFGKNVFTLGKMKERLPKDVYKEVKKVMDQGGELSMAAANVVAKAMKDWACENGATHYTHWFQPLTGITAEKHDAFVSHPDEAGKMITEFSGKELIKGEPDASSFPSGGLRATFEARGYTAWDITSPAFLKEASTGVILCIPTAFCSYTGEALDKKTPLLRSMEAVSKQALRIVRLFGNTTATKVTASVGPEQEYFLVDENLYKKRSDLMFAGRTLFGAPAPKGQEMEDHYFGVIRERVGAYMKDLNEELWKLGVTAKTQHNEVAPAQHELAPIYETANIAVDHNQLVMETMKRVAVQHGLRCLLHEKPYAGVNGSGKHDNWSITTDDGMNLLEPGDTPNENIQFLLVLACIMKAVDKHADLLRQSASDVGNDHRLGANEAPPAIISMFLGEQLEDVVKQLVETGNAASCKEGGKLETGVSTLPDLDKDATDRNRTSPFAFTGNKFEFRMLGSSNSIACANMMLNSAVAESLKIYADRLEKAENFEETLHAMIRKTIKDHKRIIFNGNGYDDAWIKEATEKRGLMNYPSTPDCMPHLLDEKNVRMLTSHKVFSKAELESRCEIMLENYCKTIVIEANTMVDMVKREIIPAVEAYAMELARTASAKKRVDETLACRYESGLIKKLSTLTDQMAVRTDALETALIELQDVKDIVAQSYQIRDTVLTRMQELRIACDEAETVTAKKYWPFPTYGDLLFSVK